MSNLAYYRAQRAQCIQAARDFPSEAHIFVRLARQCNTRILEQKRAAKKFHDSDVLRVALEPK